ncbi:hypothetical protein AMECASPLE_034698 [Ameca splendens]|uniref:Secreted protein n=1 Tax=Ameca splendens TaxID=208324 RepID=A0ABV0YUB5_9TELE
MTGITLERTSLLCTLLLWIFQGWIFVPAGCKFSSPCSADSDFLSDTNPVSACRGLCQLLSTHCGLVESQFFADSNLFSFEFYTKETMNRWNGRFI